ncbi:capsule assembly Wzi family protein [Amylibacter sp.]|nr:capsule assembly Wzi family protein [Amylibacter sp.]
MYIVKKILAIIIFLWPIPTFSQNNDLSVAVYSELSSKSTLGSQNNLKVSDKNKVGFNLNYSTKNLSSQLNFNYSASNKLDLGNSYIDYKKGIATVVFGKVDRIWSFSEKSSLILSANSVPFTTFAAKLENNFSLNSPSSTTNWSLEIINGTTKNSYNGKSSMLFGARAIISPTKRLSFELLQTSQWGGESRSLNLSSLDAIFLGNTNSGYNADINKMAGFGISYMIPLNEKNLRIYGQAVGEDEAGNLPSCYSWMTGFELSTLKIKFPTTVAIEIIDTRVDTSSHGYCGPNTMYNNNAYKYINYDTVMGVPIDSEGKSYELFGESIISHNLSMKYSVKLATINDNNVLFHRLSTKKNRGSLASLGILWKRNKLKVGGTVSYQDLSLDKTNIENGAGFNLFSSFTF